MTQEIFEPIRVSSRDLQEERKQRKGFKFFPKGNCHLLHPSLSILDKYDDCKLLYEMEYKFLYVTYGGEQKAIITSEVSSVVNTIQEYYGGN